MTDQENNEITLTLHGLTLTDGNVLARVFLAEFGKMLDALGRADKFLNKSAAHDYVIVDLKASSAIARLRETRRIRKRSRKAARAEQLGRRKSPVSYFRQAVTSIYNGDQDTSDLPARLIKDIADMAKDSGETFAHGALAFDQENVVRIDDYLSKQAQRAIERLRSVPVSEQPKYHVGLGYTSFDGVLKELDTRGVIYRGKLILTAGGKEIDCIFREEDIPQVKQQFNVRARIEGMAHYGGDSPLPERLDIKLITPMIEGDLTRWRGALEPNPSRSEERPD